MVVSKDIRVKKMPLSNGAKTGIAIAGIATAGGIIAYLLEQQTTAGGTVTSCKQQYAALTLQYNSTLQRYLAEDNKAGIAITPEQNANLQDIQEAATAQLKTCASIAESASGGLSIIEDDIGAGILTFLSLSGIAYALSILIKTGRGPKRPSSKPPTPAQQFAYMYPIIIQNGLDNGTISSDMAPTFSDYTKNTVTPYLLNQNEYVYQYYLAQNLIDEEIYDTLVAATATYITTTMEIAVALLA